VVQVYEGVGKSKENGRGDEEEGEEVVVWLRGILRIRQ